MEKYKIRSFKKVVLILGMHRSGTSNLMGNLEELGLFIGIANSKSKFNKKGNKEIPLFRQFHDKVLHENKANWKAPKIINKWSDQNLSTLRTHIKNEFKSNEVWGIKDPRLMYLLKGWFSIIPKKKMTFIASFRHPLSVSHSLLKRGNIKSIQEGLIIWRKYNHRLLRLSEKLNISFLDFDNNNEVNSEITYNIYKELIQSPKKNDLSFYDQELVNTKFDKDECPKPLKELYKKLISKSKETKNSFLNP